jgi:hypothetical protein
MPEVMIQQPPELLGKHAHLAGIRLHLRRRSNASAPVDCPGRPITPEDINSPTGIGVPSLLACTWRLLVSPPFVWPLGKLSDASGEDRED